jgi:hypothetical protein
MSAKRKSPPVKKKRQPKRVQLELKATMEEHKLRNSGLMLEIAADMTKTHGGGTAYMLGDWD